MSEIDTPPQSGTFRRYGYDLARGVAFLRAFWGRRIFGTINLFGDLLAEGMHQVFYSRLPGHPQQAPDSLAQSGADRDFFRFRGESLADFADRVWSAWDYYQQAATPQQLVRVINQWGSAGWPATWDPVGVTLVESADPLVSDCTLTIGPGLIDPPWVPWTFGSGHVFGEPGLFFGIGPSTDIPVLLYLVKKWNGARDRVRVVVYWSATDSVTFTIGST